MIKVFNLSINIIIHSVEGSIRQYSFQDKIAIWEFMILCNFDNFVACGQITQQEIILLAVLAKGMNHSILWLGVSWISFRKCEDLVYIACWNIKGTLDGLMFPGKELDECFWRASAHCVSIYSCHLYCTFLNVADDSEPLIPSIFIKKMPAKSNSACSSKFNYKIKPNISTTS